MKPLKNQKIVKNNLSTKNQRVENSSGNRFIAIDSNSLIHRAYHAYPATLRTSKGLLVNAAYGFTAMLLKLLEDLNPKYIVCAFDLGKPTFRHKQYKEYKANRKVPDTELIEQIPLIKEIVKAFNIPILEKEGYEADDILGTLAFWTDHGKWSSQDVEQIIVTGDRDLLQMVDDNTKVLLPKGGFKNLEMLDRVEVEKYYGFLPEYVTDFKSLVGDSSDNIPGVKGIGEKSAKKLIAEFGHIENLYDNLDSNLLSSREKKLLEQGEDEARMSKLLATIATDVEIDLSLEECLLRDFNYKEVVEKFRELEFRSLLNKIPDSVDKQREDSFDNQNQMGFFSDSKSIVQESKIVNYSSFEQIKDLKRDNVKAMYLSYFKDIDYLVLGVEAINEGSVSIYLEENISQNENIWTIIRSIIDMDKRVFSYGWEEIGKLLYSKFSQIKSYKSADEIRILEFSNNNLLDIQLVAYYLSTGKRDYSLQSLAFELSGIVLDTDEPNDLGQIDLYIRAMIAVAEQLDIKFLKHENSQRFIDKPTGYNLDTLKDIDQPLSLTCAHMSLNGIGIDSGQLERLFTKFDNDISILEKDIFESIGHEFNIDSPKQLSSILFDELNLPTQKRTKTGFSTNEAVLQELKPLHPCIEKILQYRELVKLNNTYVKPLLEYAKSSLDNRIRSTFNQMTTTTGRLSSTDPNLQNIPTRSVIGKKIKAAFVSAPEKVFVAADYSQIELRIMAHLSCDKNMINDFRSGVDFHTLTAVHLLNVEADKVTKNDRRIAKAINFGILYGLSPYGLAQQLAIDQSQAAEYIANYFAKYSGVKEYLESCIYYARKNGYLETIAGRRRYFTGINSSNNQQRSAVEREAINFPIQGSAADIMRIAMNRIYKDILAGRMHSTLVLQIHDELVLECNKGDADFIQEFLCDVLTSVVQLRIPLNVETHVGLNLREVE